MAITKLISLTEESFKVWEERFKGGQEFSAWVQDKLVEERYKEDSPEVIRRGILDLTADIEKLNAKRALLQKRLQLILEDEQIKSKNLLEEEERNAKRERNSVNEKLVLKIGAIIQYQLKVKMEREKFRETSTNLAELYASIPEPKPDLKEFLIEEVKHLGQMPLL